MTTPPAVLVTTGATGDEAAGLLRAAGLTSRGRSPPRTREHDEPGATLAGVRGRADRRENGRPGSSGTPCGTSPVLARRATASARAGGESGTKVITTETRTT